MRPGLMRLALSLIAAAACVACGGGAGLASVQPSQATKPNAECAMPGSEGNTPSSLRFAILPDRTGQERPGKFEQAIATIGALDPEFVISVGDLIEGYTEDTAAVEAEWDELDTMIAPLGVPMCAAVGNHDVWDEASGQIWEERRGERYYAFRRGGALFLILDTEDPPQPLPPEVQARQAALKQAWANDPLATQERILEAVRGREPTTIPGQTAIRPEQVEWARQTLGAHADARWTFVILHRPAWKEDPNPLAEIEALLAERKHTVIAGHEHYFEVFKRHGADYIVTATAGGVWLRDGPGRLDHVLLVEMDEDPSSRPVITSVPLASRVSE